MKIKDLFEDDNEQMTNLWYKLERIDMRDIDNLNKLKSDWIKYLILNLRSGNIRLSRALVTSLKCRGVTWPELDIIEKSINSEIEKNHNINEDADEDLAARLESKLTPIISAKDIELFNQNKNDYIKYLLLLIKTGGQFVAKNHITFLRCSGSHLARIGYY